MYRYQDIIVIDFEGFKGKPPSMVGIWEKYPNRNQPYYRVIILDQDLKGLVDIKDLRAIYVDLNDKTNYVDNMEVVSIASKLLLAAAFFQISDSIQVLVLGALRGLQDVKIPTILTFISYWVVGFPVSYFLGKEEVYGSFGIWLGLLAGLTTASILLFIRFNKLTLKLIKEKEKLILE